LTEIADFIREEKGILSITPLQRDMLDKDTRFKMFSGRMMGKGIPRPMDYLQFYSDCREKQVKWEDCDVCEMRFKCWTAGRPQVAVIGDTHIGLQRLQQCMKVQMITVDEASEAFKNLSCQICEAMTKKLDENVLE